jgi:DNA-binding transcriptional ArsR family regulator
MPVDVQKSFKALADPTRREILQHLSEGDMSIGELVDKFPITRAAVKKHLSLLEEVDLISVRIDGREKLNHLEPQGLRNVTEWLSFFDQFWDKRLTALQNIIKNQ